MDPATARAHLQGRYTADDAEQTEREPADRSRTARSEQTDREPADRSKTDESEATDGAEDGTLTGTMVATPGDGTCGIGTYARDLCAAFEDVSWEIATIDQDDRSVLTVVRLAVAVMRSDTDVVHVQHEYGLFRRAGVDYPGVMGLVFFPVLIAMNLLERKRIVVTMHSAIRPSPTAARRDRWYLVVMHELIATAADHLVFLSEECQRDFRASVDIDEAAASVFPHGVNTANARDIARPAAKAAFGFDPEDAVVVIPGFVRPPKGHDIFLEVAERLPNHEFLIAGGARPKGEDADFAREIREQAPENVTMTGHLSEERFPVALAAADLALLPYRVVTQSGTFNWCVAQGCPILASEVDYFTRMDAEWGTAETVAIDNRDAIAARVDALLDSDRRRSELRMNCRRYRQANSFEAVAREHTRIYRGEQPSDRVTATRGADPEQPRTASPRAACSARPDPRVESVSSP